MRPEGVNQGIYDDSWLFCSSCRGEIETGIPNNKENRMATTITKVPKLGQESLSTGGVE